MPSALAALLAEIWFGATASIKVLAAERGLRVDAVAGLQRMANDVDARCGLCHCSGIV